MTGSSASVGTAGAAAVGDFAGHVGLTSAVFVSTGAGCGFFANQVPGFIAFIALFPPPPQPASDRHNINNKTFRMVLLYDAAITSTTASMPVSQSSREIL